MVTREPFDLKNLSDLVMSTQLIGIVAPDKNLVDMAIMNYSHNWVGNELTMVLESKSYPGYMPDNVFMVAANDVGVVLYNGLYFHAETISHSQNENRQHKRVTQIVIQGRVDMEKLDVEIVAARLLDKRDPRERIAFINHRINPIYTNDRFASDFINAQMNIKPKP